MLADTEEVALSFENAQLGSSSNLIKIDRIRNPFTIFFHLLFRSLAIFSFIFANWIYSSFITVFVAIVVLLSMDFWTVKNVSGRLLVGLRWWNHVDEDGIGHWVFENRKTNQANNQMQSTVLESTAEANIFWTSLIATNLIWLFFLFVCVFTFNFKWLIIIAVALMLNGSNTYGFLKCRYGSERNMQNLASGFFSNRLMQLMFSRFATDVAANVSNVVASATQQGAGASATGGDSKLPTLN